MAATSQTIIDGQRVVVAKFHNDAGSDETVVKKVDVSTLASQLHTGSACTKVAIEQVWYDISTDVILDIIWDATANVTAWSLSAGQGHLDFRGIGPIVNNAGAGVTGDVLFTTVGAGAGDRYSVILALRKTYG